MYIYLLVLLFASCGEGESQNTDSNTQNEQEDANPTPTSEDATWTGTYENDGITLKLIGPDEEGSVQFEISQGSEKCAELNEGAANLVSESTAEYLSEDDGCKLTFRFADGEIQVSEADCGTLHGAACASYDGVYKMTSGQ